MPATYTDRIDGLTTSIAVKAPCRVATTGPITLTGEQTVDGVAVVAEDRVLVQNQLIAINNGIYVADTSVWLRARDFDGNRDVAKGTLVLVNEGATYAASLFRVGSNAAGQAIEIDADTVTFDRREDFTPNNVSDFGTAGGTAGALTGATLPATAAYETGRVYTGIAAATAGAGATIDLGPGAVAIKHLGAANLAGAWVSGDALALFYDGAFMQVLSPLRNRTQPGNVTISGTLAAGATNVTGALAATGAVSGASLAVTGAATAASVTATGAVDGGSIKRSGVDIPVQRSVTLAAQTIGADGTLMTFAHGLSAAPAWNRVSSTLQCKASSGGEAGYAEGQLAYNSTAYSGAETNGVVLVLTDATNVYYRVGSAGPGTFHYTTGAPTALTNAKWELIVTVDY
jgi:hypothetical protein